MNKVKELLNMIGTTITYVEILNISTKEDIINFAKDNNLVIAYGYSDDNIEFEGAIYDEIGVWEKTNFFVTKDKNLIHPDVFDNEECAMCTFRKYYFKNIEKAKIRAVYNGLWELDIDIPHEKFTITDDDFKGKGLIFALDDISK